MHVIRLRRPWQRKCAGQTQVVDVPDAIDSPVPAGIVSYRRSFNAPSGLEPSTILRIRIEHWSGKLVQLLLNDQPIGHEEMERVDLDVSGLLKPHNVLEVVLSDDAQPACLTGEVTLAIEE